MNAIEPKLLTKHCAEIVDRKKGVFQNADIVPSLTLKSVLFNHGVDEHKEEENHGTLPDGQYPPRAVSHQPLISPRTRPQRD